MAIIWLSHLWTHRLQNIRDLLIQGRKHEAAPTDPGAKLAQPILRLGLSRDVWRVSEEYQSEGFQQVA